MKRRALVLGGGFDQIGALVYLKQRQFQTTIVDFTAEPVAKAFADQHICKSALSISDVMDAAIESEASVIISTCIDQALPIAAAAAEALDIAFYIDSKLASELTNKHHLKRFMSASGVKTAPFALAETKQNICEALSLLRLPIVIKPTDSNSSKGVFRCDRSGDVLEKFEASLSSSRAREVVLEEFIEGDELSIDAWVSEGGVVTILSITILIKENSDSDNFPISYSIYSPQLLDKFESEARDLSEKIASAAKLRDSPLLIQCIANEDGLNVLEFSPRLGGGCKVQLINAIRNTSIMQSMVDAIIDGKSRLELDKRSDAHFAMIYIYTAPCTFGAFSLNKTIPGVCEVYILKTKGTEIRSSGTSSDRVAAVMIKGKSAQELLATAQEVITQSRVTTPDGDFVEVKTSPPD